MGAKTPQQAWEKIAHTAKLSERQVGAPTLDQFKIGFSLNQGDLRLERVSDNFKYGKPWPHAQLVEGTTRGSRHVITDLSTCKVFYPTDKENPLSGPVIVAIKDTTITHPEHRHYILPAGCTVHCVYQRDYAQEEIQRVQD